MLTHPAINQYPVLTCNKDRTIRAPVVGKTSKACKRNSKSINTIEIVIANQVITYTVLIGPGIPTLKWSGFLLTPHLH